MALVQGLPRAADGALQLTADTTGMAWVAGFRRRPSDGALVATTSTAGATMQRGFLRAPTGELVYADAAATYRRGFGRTATDALAIQTTDPATEPQHGLKLGTLGRVYCAVVA